MSIPSNYFPSNPSAKAALISVILVMVLVPTNSEIRPCLAFDNGSSIRCIKDNWKKNGDDFGRVGILNKSKCPSVRFMKQEWRQPCGSLAEANGTLTRVSPGEVLQFGAFQQEMLQDYVQLKECGQLRILQCYCDRKLVDCQDVLWVATYNRGEHIHLVEKFRSIYYPPPSTTTRKPGC